MRFSSLSFLAIAVLLLSPAPAQAYLDPVTGSFLIQGLIGLIAAILVGVKKIRQWILVKLGFRKLDKKPGAGEK